MGKLFAYYLFLIFALVGMKNSFANISKTTLEKNEWGASFSYGLYSDFKDVQSESKVFNSILGLNLSKKLATDYYVSVSLSHASDLKAKEEASLNDTYIALSKGHLKLTERLSYSTSIVSVIPTSKKSSNDETLITALNVSNTFSVKMSNYLFANYSISLSKKFHRFKTSESNNSNTEYGAIQSLGFSYLLSDKVTFIPSYSFSDSWSYTGRRKNTSYIGSAQLSFKMKSNMSALFGVSQGGSLVNYEKKTNDGLKIFDENESSFYTKLEVTL